MALPSIPPPPETRFERIARALGDVGWHVERDFVDERLARRLARECREARDEGKLRRAAIGTGWNRQVRGDIRSDQVLWLEPGSLSAAQQRYFDDLEQLRGAINQHLFLGLFEFEGHFARYPVGSFYRKHLDQFQGAHQRIVSCILYVNPDWEPADGGALRVYLGEGGEGECVDIAPTAGTLVTFLSEYYYHEVLPAARERLSVTGWFRTR